MSPRAEIGYLVGYVASNIWRIWFPHRQCVEDRRDCVFDENQLFNPEKPVSEIPDKSGQYQAAYAYDFDLPADLLDLKDLEEELEPRWRPEVDGRVEERDSGGDSGD